jgi:metal-responsive CopG/Arc/MetJ family transcriptional regulator
MSSRIASTNIPSTLMASIDEAAARAGITRSAFIRWALETTISGDRARPTAEEHRARLVRASFARDRVRLANATNGLTVTRALS